MGDQSWSPSQNIEATDFHELFVLRVNGPWTRLGHFKPVRPTHHLVFSATGRFISTRASPWLVDQKAKPVWTRDPATAQAWAVVLAARYAGSCSAATSLSVR